MFHLSSVEKSFGGVRALKPFSLSIPAGETLAILGPSGSGKSTLLKLLIGILAPDAGHISFRGKEIGEGGLAEYRRHIGLVIQEGGLFPHLTAHANIAIMARHLKWPQAKIEARIAELCTLVHLPQDRLSHYLKELSGGERQRIALMRALMLDPDVLLLDEPLGALDPMIRYDLQQDLKSIFATLKKTVILITHDLAEAHYLASAIILMRDGGIEQSGSYQDLASNPATPFVRRFLQAQRGLALGRAGA